MFPTKDRQGVSKISVIIQSAIFTPKNKNITNSTPYVALTSWNHVPLPEYSIVVIIKAQLWIGGKKAAVDALYRNLSSGLLHG
jgi:hypothetical protein